MPGDATHVKSAKFVAFVVAVVMYGLGVSAINIAGMVLVFMFGIMYLSPDLDLPRVDPVQRWGGLKIMWALFEKRIPHRSRWSHGWILGALTIHVYFLTILAILITFLRLCWLPLIEPLIATGNDLIDDLLSLNISNDLMVSILVIWLCLLAAHLHHKILDTFMRN